jgi:Asp-tRNA(Asn)/Glu-tRNA(Gln) amidotransferase A subunit family amidase
MDVTQLKEGLLRGDFTSVDLVNVFGKRCYTIGRRLCLSAEEDFDSALVEAAEKDRERREAIHSGTQGELPVLHGIPVSIKEMVRDILKQYQIGYSSTSFSLDSILL